MNRHWIAFILLSMLFTGCSRFHTDYGDSSGMKGKQSINGFAAFRDLLEAPTTATTSEAELKTRDLGRLSSRADKLDAIIWIPQPWPPSNKVEVKQWMHRWLRRKNRTIVFIVPDGGSTEVYFREAADMAIPAQRLEYRRRLASQINDRLLEDGRRSNVVVKDWFEATAMPYRMFLDDRRVADFNLSDHSDLIADEDLGASNLDDVDLVELDNDELFDEINALLDEESENSKIEDPVASDSTSFESLRQESITLSSKPIELTTLARVRHEQWRQSQVLVVASGGLLTNFAMTGEKSTAMAKMIRDEIRIVSRGDQATTEDPLRVGFLSSDTMPIAISNAKPGAPAATGMEVLTTWPLSLVTMHGLFLGVVMCLMLLPAFGRPRNIRHNRTTHFGNHLSAMATLMRRSGRSPGSVMFAKKKISQYLRIVRGETVGPWVLPEATVMKEPTSMPKSKSDVAQNQKSSADDAEFHAN